MKLTQRSFSAAASAFLLAFAAALPAAAQNVSSSSSGRLHLDYAYECLNKGDYDTLKKSLAVVGPADLHPCKSGETQVYVARCSVTGPGGAAYRERVNIAQTCPEMAGVLKDYDGPVPQFQCDFLHAMPNVMAFMLSFDGVKSQPSMPVVPYTPAQQKSYLAQTYCEAGYAHAQYLKWAKEPKKINDAFSLSIQAFLWQRVPLGGSYLVKGKKTSIPVSWYPYLRPLLVVSKADKAREQEMVRAVAGKIKTLEASGLNQENFGLMRMKAWLGGLFDQSQAGKGGQAVLAGPGSLLVLPKKVPGPDLSPLFSKSDRSLRPKYARGAPPLPSLDNAAAVKQENFGARGIEAAMSRIKQEYEITFWHYFGMSTTIGHPLVALPYIVHQKSGTCGVESQYEALRAHDISANPAALAQEAYKNGWYGENDPQAGISSPFEGTEMPNSNQLLTAHHLPSKLIYQATTRDLKQSIAYGGGAIVALRSNRLWDDKPGPVDHAVYVSGAELGSNGKILGYYVNDTGTGEGMRYVPAQQFEEAWEDKTGHGFLVSLDRNAKPPKVELKPKPAQLTTYLKEDAGR